MFQHEFDCFVIEVRPVLDCAASRTKSSLDASGSVRVRHHGDVSTSRFFDDDREFLITELLVHGIVTQASDTARRADFDCPDSRAQKFTNGNETFGRTVTQPKVASPGADLVDPMRWQLVIVTMPTST
jgi:hypothetical protein